MKVIMGLTTVMSVIASILEVHKIYDVHDGIDGCDVGNGINAAMHMMELVIGRALIL
jgi:hypothetical protein